MKLIACVYHNRLVRCQYQFGKQGIIVATKQYNYTARHHPKYRIAKQLLPVLILKGV